MIGRSRSAANRSTSARSTRCLSVQRYLDRGLAVTAALKKALETSTSLGLLYPTDMTHPVSSVITIASAGALDFCGSLDHGDFNEAYNAIATRTLPEEMRSAIPLTRKQKAALVAVGAVGVGAVIEEGFAAYYFGLQTPADFGFSAVVKASKTATVFLQIGSGLLAVGAAVNSALTEGFYDTFKEVKVKFAGNATPLHPGKLKYLGIPLALLETVSEGATALSTISGVTSGGTDFTFSTLAKIKIPFSFYFAVHTNMAMVDGFVHAEKRDPKKIAAFMLALAASTYLAYLKRAVNEAFLAQTFFNASSAPAVSWAVCAQETTQGISTFYPVMYRVVEATIKFPRYLADKLSCRRRAASVLDEEQGTENETNKYVIVVHAGIDNDEENPLHEPSPVSLGNNRSGTLYGTVPPKAAEPVAAPERKWDCTIL